MLWVGVEVDGAGYVVQIAKIEVAIETTANPDVSDDGGAGLEEFGGVVVGVDSEVPVAFVIGRGCWVWLIASWNRAVAFTQVK